MNHLNFTEQDTRNDFERMKKGEIYWNQVRGFNDEHKWWIINNMKDSTFLSHDELMTDEMIKECIIHGICDFFKVGFFKSLDADDIKPLIDRIKNLGLTEEEWLQAIKNREIKHPGMFPDEMILMVETCAELTVDICFAIINKNPFMVVEKVIRDILLESNRKYEFSSFFVHQVFENNLHVQIPNDLPIDEETWNYIEGLNLIYWNNKYLLKRSDCPISIRRKAIEESEEAWAIRDEMTADDVLYWFEYYKDKVEAWRYVKNFHCDNWEDVVAKKNEIFPYIPKQTAKVCEIAVKANPENIKYVRKPSEKLKKLALTLNPNCKQYIDITEKTCKMMGWNIEEKTPDPYPAPYYLVKFSEDLCDEGYLNYVTVVKGKNMNHFINKSFTVSFGNLDDDTTRYVRDCASIQEITKEEYDILCKLGLDNIESGFFYFKD